MKKPCSEMFCLRNQDITDAKAFFHLFFMSNSGYLDRHHQRDFSHQLIALRFPECVLMLEDGRQLQTEPN